MYRIGFCSAQLCIRGTTAALRDYAMYNESMLGNQSVIIYKKNHRLTHPEQEAFFNSRFTCEAIPEITIEALNNVALKHRLDAIYYIRHCWSSQPVATVCPSMVHGVFGSVAYGDAFAYVSASLATKYQTGHPYVPHMIDIDMCQDSMRSDLGIPDDAIVYGSYGGSDAFNIESVHRALQQHVNSNSNVYVLFMNINESPLLPRQERVAYLPGSIDKRIKRRFVNSCDAMIHARCDGETFGIAIGEFSMGNKPIFTHSGEGLDGYDKEHIRILGSRAWIYNSEQSLLDRFGEFESLLKQHRMDGTWNTIDWKCYGEYAPNLVMAQFESVFLKPLGLTRELSVSQEAKSQEIELTKENEGASKKDVCIVTAFFDINRHTWEHYSRTSSTYMQYFENLSHIQQPLIAYIDDRYIDDARNRCRHRDGALFTLLIPINLEFLKKHIHGWSIYDRQVEIMQSDDFQRKVVHRQHCPEANNTNYVTITNSKVDFVHRAITVDAIGQFDYFAWVDFGYIRKMNVLPECQKCYFTKITECIDVDAVHFITLRDPQKTIDGDAEYTLIHAPEVIIGGVWVGSVQAIIRYRELYHKTIEKLQAMNIVDDDQGIAIHIYCNEPYGCLKMWRNTMFSTYGWFSGMRIFESDSNITPCPIDSNDTKS